MAVETRHLEKTILYWLLKAKKTGDFNAVIKQLMASMEQDDVEIVKKRVAESDDE